MANLFLADYHGWRAVAGLSKVTVRQKFGNHTLFFLDYSISKNQQHLLPPEGTPVQVRFGSAPLGVRTAYGYVNHLEERVDEENRKFTRLVALGTSKVMNSVTPTSWVGHTRSSILRDLGTRYRFRTVMHSHPEVLETWASGALTDFRVANLLADEIGYRLWVDGATMWMLDPHLVLASASTTSTKVVHLSQQRKSQVFKGTNVPGQVKASKRLVQYGVSRTTNELVVATSGDTSLPVEMLSGSAASYTQAQFAAEGTQKSMLDQAVVDASFDGDATITPGSPIRFDQTATSRDQMGLWLVNEAVHEISGEGFTTRISGSRDKDRVMTSRVLDVVRREGSLSRAVIRNGKTWEAEMQERVNV
jgi:hypothetical protein